MNFYSPLRYPGGKASFTKLFLRIFSENDLSISTYYEFYAGGAGAALELLLNDHVQRIVLNDADYHVYAFWNAIIYDTENFLKKIIDTPVTIDEWQNQKRIYEDITGHDVLTIGFSTFFLNRTNRSGILMKAGPIGGQNQDGNYKLDARYNKTKLSERITQIAKKESSITIYNEDAILLMNTLRQELMLDTSFLFLDPPYYEKGSKLYLNHYNDPEHTALRDFLLNNRNFNWIVSYDNAEAIQEMYTDFSNCLIDINYSLQSKKKEKEIVIFSDKLRLQSEPI